MTKEQHREYIRRKHEDAKPAYHALMSCYPFTLDDLDGEQWKDIAGYNGDYQISTYGRVKSFKKGRTMILKPQLFSEYLTVDLCGNGKTKHQQIHILVARSFIPNPEDKPEVNHRVGMKFNCHVSNLEWSTSAENTRHAYDNGLAKSAQGCDDFNAKIKNEADIIYIRENPDHLTQDELAEMFGVKRQTISLIQRGKTYANVGGSVRKPQKYTPRIPDEIRAAIRADWATGNYKSYSALGRKYGCDHKTIIRIVTEG